MKPALALIVVLSGCLADPPEGRPILGSPADVMTPSGDYDGYRVERACDQSYVDVGVIGTGAITPATTAEISAIGNDLYTPLADIASVWGWGGFGLGCEAGASTSVMLDDWRDVDTIISRTGAFLRERDLALQVSISIESIPVPAAE